MKKRIFLLFFLATFFTVASKAQGPSFNLGLKAGFNYTQLKSDNKLFDSSDKSGYHAGLWTRIGLGKSFIIQPEVYYTNKNTSITETTGGQSSNAKFYSVDIPVLIGTKLNLGLASARLQVGPMLSYIVDKDIKLVDKSTIKNHFTAVVGGVGLDISRFSVDLRYEYGTGDLTKDNSIKSMNLWTIGIGLQLF